MSIPSTGILLIPLGFLLAFMPWRFCLAGLMVLAMMSPAAVVNAGSFGLQPGYYLALLLIARTMGQVITHRFTLNVFVLSRLKLLFWFTVVVFAVLFVALCFFAGKVETLPGSYGFKSGLTHPFQLARENFTQIAYLLINMFLIYGMGHYGARQEPRKLLGAWDAALVCGLIFAVTICVWQFASLYAGIWFPGDFFYSNAGYSRADSQSMVGLFRINGPFEEPSTLGYTFTGYILYAWGRLKQHPTGLTLAMIGACVFCMLVSTSTTAFLGLFLFACAATFDFAVGRVSLFPPDAKRSYYIVMGLGVLAIIGGIFVAAANWSAINIILHNTLINKSQSTSFQQRSFADLLALQIFGETYGIGVGLGSHKANSLLLTLLSNTGVIGLILFGAFAWSLVWWRPAPGGAAVFSVPALRPFQLGLIGLIAIHVFSNPNLSSLTLWLAMGGLLAFQASDNRLRLAERTASVSAADDFKPRLAYASA